MRNTELRRLEAVHKFELLDFDHNKGLNDLVVLAIEICNVPMALITLLDKDVQWIKCKLGINIEQNDRQDSFCKYTLDKPDVLVVNDALLDERFVNNPFVKVDDGIRFYAGAPLIDSDGNHLGSLCVLDRKPRPFSKKQKEMLAILSRQVMNMMELQMSLKQIKSHNAELNIQKKKVFAQNKSLLNIAFIQSHEYRRPVASILGLMNVIKGYNYRASKKCLMMMETAVNELDEKIRLVANHTHDAIIKYAI